MATTHAPDVKHDDHQREIDWSSAEVRDRALTVELT
jgi:hypothetical protein